MSSSNAYSSQSGSSQGGSSQTYSSQSGSSQTYSSQSSSSKTYSSQMMNIDDCIMMSDADMLKSKESDPLNALHEQNLASNPDLDVSILSDDEYFAAYSSQAGFSTQAGYSSQVKYEEECTMMSDADILKSKEYDPLNALHEQNLASNPDLDVSVLTDDEYFALLKSAKETKA